MATFKHQPAREPYRPTYQLERFKNGDLRKTKVLAQGLTWDDARRRADKRCGDTEVPEGTVFYEDDDDDSHGILVREEIIGQADMLAARTLRALWEVLERLPPVGQRHSSVNLDKLQDFGGDRPVDTPRVISWDRTNCIVAMTDGTFELLSRDWKDPPR